VVKQQVRGGTFNRVAADRRPIRVFGLHAVIRQRYGHSQKADLPLNREIG